LHFSGDLRSPGGQSAGDEDAPAAGGVGLFVRVGDGLPFFTEIVPLGVVGDGVRSRSEDLTSGPPPTADGEGGTPPAASLPGEKMIAIIAITAAMTTRTPPTSTTCRPCLDPHRSHAVTIVVMPDLSRCRPVT
jgi:hypothetical protein